MINILMPRLKEKFPNYSELIDDKVIYHINPTGKFVIGGPMVILDLLEEK